MEIHLVLCIHGTSQLHVHILADLISGLLLKLG